MSIDITVTPETVYERPFPKPMQNTTGSIVVYFRQSGTGIVLKHTDPALVMTEQTFTNMTQFVDVADVTAVFSSEPVEV